VRHGEGGLASNPQTPASYLERIKKVAAQLKTNFNIRNATANAVLAIKNVATDADYTILSGKQALVGPVSTSTSLLCWTYWRMTSASWQTGITRLCNPFTREQEQEMSRQVIERRYRRTERAVGQEISDEWNPMMRGLVKRF
jgi:hypothetical protein